MVGTSTARLGLYKPDDNDNVDVDQDLNANSDKLDLLGKKPEPITNPFIKRNTLDAIGSSETLCESLTVTLKANHWYEAMFQSQFNTSLAVNTTPNGVVSIRLKSGGTVLTTDPQIAIGTPPNQSNCSPRFACGETFDVPADGSYTLGVTGNSGGANTLNLLASGGADNTGNKRCLWVKDLGEK